MEAPIGPTPFGKWRIQNNVRALPPDRLVTQNPA
jgi:hypothetical protein